MYCFVGVMFASCVDNNKTNQGRIANSEVVESASAVISQKDSLVHRSRRCNLSEEELDTMLILSNRAVTYKRETTLDSLFDFFVRCFSYPACLDGIYGEGISYDMYELFYKNDSIGTIFDAYMDKRV